MKTLLDKAWDNSLEKVIEYLEGLGASVVDADRIAQAACQATNASNLTLIYPEEGQRFSRQGQLFFLNSPNNLWYTELIDPSEGLLEFQPIPATRAGQRVERYLRGMVGEDSLTPEG
jgi:hypothetical protein